MNSKGKIISCYRQFRIKTINNMSSVTDATWHILLQSITLCFTETLTYVIISMVRVIILAVTNR